MERKNCRLAGYATRQRVGGGEVRKPLRHQPTNYSLSVIKTKYRPKYHGAAAPGPRRGPWISDGYSRAFHIVLICYFEEITTDETPSVMT